MNNKTINKFLKLIEKDVVSTIKKDFSWLSKTMAKDLKTLTKEQKSLKKKDK
tara:strand:+ start:3743 stop:3898 length:156 start_codon:yes stop_codon:yes gene_type:complete